MPDTIWRRASPPRVTSKSNAHAPLSNACQEPQNARGGMSGAHPKCQPQRHITTTVINASNPLSPLKQGAWLPIRALQGANETTAHIAQASIGPQPLECLHTSRAARSASEGGGDTNASDNYLGPLRLSRQNRQGTNRQHHRKPRALQ